MPELPEVETTRLGIAPHLCGQQIAALVVRNASLRWPVPADLADRVCGQVIKAVRRRGKYLLIDTGRGSMIWHLGMSGSMRIVNSDVPVEKHDHIDLVVGAKILRFNDPRRFGCLLWGGEHPETHTLIAKLGPEPLSDEFSADTLFVRSRKRQQAIKNFIMDSKTVVGVGNIYASESLYRAGIRPTRAVGRVSKQRYQRLHAAIKQVLKQAIKAGGTTLNDFTQSDGQPGYFAQELGVYGREGEACGQCGSAIKRCVIGQRASYFCPRCQT